MSLFNKKYVPSVLTHKHLITFSLALRERVGVRVNLHAFQHPLTLTLENQFQTFSTDCILAVVSPATMGERVSSLQDSCGPVY